MPIMNEVQKAVWKDAQGLSSLLTYYRDAFQAITGANVAVASAILQGDVVGINEAAIPGMKTAVITYVDNLKNHLKNVKTTADTSQAFKGDYAAAVTDYVNAVCDSCGCIISNLLAFNDRLDVVYQAYVAKDTQMASDIRGQAGDLNSSFTEYNSGNN